MGKGAVHRTLSFEWVLGPNGWQQHRRLVIDHGGVILAVEPESGGAYDGWLAFPALANAHSHCFQRVLRGLGDRTGLDSFWSWRELMYRIANRLDPPHMQVIARACFAEMLEAGYTSVGEFHYLHHERDGSRSPSMTDALVAAADATGIRLRLLPVYYRTGGFGMPSEAAQHRFLHDSPDEFARTIEPFADVCAGVAPHSLRAVPIGDLPPLLEIASQLIGPQSVVHIHVSEQAREVTECVARYGRPPVALLDECTGLNSRWNLVHATHAGWTERKRIIETGATVVLCPLTEAYLGDGLFPAVEYVPQGGRFAVGSDSNACIDAFGELRFLEFSQRNARRERLALSDERGPGCFLWSHAAATGASALGLTSGRIEVGQLADLVVLPHEDCLPGLPAEAVLDALLLRGLSGLGCSVYVGGRLRVEQGVCVERGESGRLAGVIRHLLEA